VLKALFDASDGRIAKVVRANSVAHYGKSNIIQRGDYRWSVFL
jgi:hypothetical protein